ncbi:MAG: AAA family ATPase, partial [Anaerolineales bacterium]|nr:AAA family ATPase [Anaerolineales bacterium]
MKAAIKSAPEKLKVFLFGTMRFEQNGVEVPLPSSAAARSLLACLLANHNRSQSRSALIGLFWPEMSEERARRALSQALWNIRRSVPDLLDINSKTISISKGITLWVDIESFEQMVKPALDAAPLDENARQNLEQALDLYRADFLDGIYHDWALLERERLRELYLQALEQLSQLEKAAGRYAKALDLALRLSHAEPLSETAHCEIMRLHQLLGQPDAALRQFELCRQILRQELGVEPELETLALGKEISHRSEANPLAVVKPGKERGNLVPAPLVGREDDRATLLQHVEGVFNKLGGLILLEGEAGVGKTRLLQEIARDAEWRGAQVLWGQAREAQSLQPYAPLVEALQAGLSPLRVTQIHQMVERLWLQVIHPLLPILAAGLPDLEPAPRLEPAQEQTRLVEAITQVLNGWAGIVPLILILEDLHWADQDTLKLLPTLVRRLSSFGILIICSYRGEEARAHPQVWETLQAVSRGSLLERRVISRLDESATGELIRRSLGLASPAPLFEVRIHHETDGNPLFVLETLRALQDNGLLKRKENGGWSTPWDETTADYAELPLPPLVEKVISSRLKLLPAKPRHLLDMMAVLGNRFDFGLLGAVSGLEAPALLERTRELIRRAFLEETDSGYRFGHDKIHQVVYEGMETRGRIRFHRRVAAYLRETRPTEIDALAYHYWEAQKWDKASYYHQLAGERAEEVYANAEAMNHFSRALEAIQRLPGSPDLRQ